MEHAPAALATRARSIFDGLGYTVLGDGSQFRAERDWKVVQVTATDGQSVPEGDGLHCYVTPREHVGTLRNRLAQHDESEWAIIAVDGDDYEVVDAPPGPDAPA